MAAVAYSRDQIVYDPDPFTRLEKVKHNLSVEAYYSGFSDEVSPFTYADPDCHPMGLEWYAGFVYAHYFIVSEQAELLLAEIQRLEQEEDKKWDDYQEDMARDIL